MTGKNEEIKSKTSSIEESRSEIDSLGGEIEESKGQYSYFNRNLMELIKC